MGDRIGSIDDEIVVKSPHFTIVLQAQALAVLCIPIEYLSKCSWWLMREYQQKNLQSSAVFRSILMDDDGLSVVCDPGSVPVLQHFLQPSEYLLSPNKWRAFIINVTGSAYEVPGAVYCLANSLSVEGLSILHISTYESEVFLIQQPDVPRAMAILKTFEDAETTAALLDAACRYSAFPANDGNQSEIMSPRGDLDSSMISDPSSALKAGMSFYDKEDAQVDGQLDLSWITPQQKSHSFINESKFSKTKKFETGFTLCVLPRPLLLATLNLSNPDIDVAKCFDALITLLLYEDRFNPVERIVAKGGSPDSMREELQTLDKIAKKKKQDIERATFMWGSWQYNDELTFLLEECDVSSFPPDSLLISPQKWRVIKLCGRPIAFDETGVVSAMSRVDANVPSLNISTVITNCTLVPEELLETTATSLSQALNCPVKYA